MNVVLFTSTCRFLFANAEYTDETKRSHCVQGSHSVCAVLRVAPACRVVARAQ